MQSPYITADIHHHHQHQQHQQFMATDDSSPSSPFSISNSHKPNNLLHYHQYQQQQQHITQQFFQHPHHFQPFQQQQQRRLHHNLGTETFPFFTVNFKLGLNENNGSREGASNNEEEVEVEQEEEAENGCLFRGNQQHVPENRPNSLVMHPHYWQPQEDSAIKQPLWKPLSTELFITDNKRCNEGDEAGEKLATGINQQGNKELEKNYRHFGELEAIYETNQTGTGSALTAENSPTNASLKTMSFDHPHEFNVNVNVTAAGASNMNAAPIGVNYDGSETSIGEEEALLRKKKSEKRKRKRKMRDKLGSMTGFFERLVKQLMDHQEGLHEKFLRVIEKMDQERLKREEAWRFEEAEKYNREALARAHEQALASCRDAAIVSCLEKMTGQSMNLLPLRRTATTPQLNFQNEITEEPIRELRHINNRWPKAEVEALIQIRSELELKFQEPGLKGLLWEEISTSMGLMGYIRSAKRCKEKWENINKYFRKTKESAKKRSQISKTCPYFEQLDQLYSRPGSSSASSSISNNVRVQMRGNNSELLEAIIARNDMAIAQNPCVVEMGPLKLAFNDNVVDGEIELQHGKEKEKHDEEMEGENLKDNEDEEEEEEQD